MSERVDLFYSYAPADNNLAQQLDEALALLRRQGTLDTWHAGRVGAGELRQDLVANWIETAKVILLLVSSSFIASPDCYDLEMQRALQRVATGKAVAVVVLLRPCDWRSGPFAHLPTLPRNKKPVTAWSNPDLAWEDVALGVRQIVTQLTFSGWPAALTVPELDGITANSPRALPRASTPSYSDDGIEPALKPGTMVGGRFRILDLLSAGGFGQVYVAEQQLGTKKRRVAVKVLHPQFARDPLLVPRFLREGALVSELEHPNTVKFFDFGKTDSGDLYIAMEFIDGRTLADEMSRPGRACFPLERLDRILGQVCGALQEAHDKGIVHCDLKPSNIFLTRRAGEDDFVKVLDFGIATVIADQVPSSPYLKSGPGMGTPPYMSPEQFRGRNIDARTDIYSLGLIAYEMISGRMPFRAATAEEWAVEHLVSPPLPLRAPSANSPVTRRVHSAIMRALSKDRNQRQGSAREFFEDLSLEVESSQDEATLLGIPPRCNLVPEINSRSRVEQDVTEPRRRPPITTLVRHRMRTVRPTRSTVLDFLEAATRLAVEADHDKVACAEKRRVAARLYVDCIEFTLLWRVRTFPLGPHAHAQSLSVVLDMLLSLLDPSVKEDAEFAALSSHLGVVPELLLELRAAERLRHIISTSHRLPLREWQFLWAQCDGRFRIASITENSVEVEIPERTIAWLEWLVQCAIRREYTVLLEE